MPRPALGVLLTATIVALSALLAPPSAAAQGATFSILPAGAKGFFIFDSAPGSAAGGKVRVANVGDTAGQVRLSAVDATTGQTSGVVYLASAAPRRGVGSWVSLSSSSLTLGPHQSDVVAFTVHVPPEAGAGQHLGGLVAAPVQPERTTVTHSKGSTFRVQINEIAIVAVQVDVPGPAVQRISITSLSASGRPGYQTLMIGLDNVGNTLVKGAGRIEVDTSTGRRVLDQRFALDTVVPQTSIDFPVYVRGKRVQPGHYRAVVSIVYGRGHEFTRAFGLTVSSGQFRQTYGSPGPGNAAIGVPGHSGAGSSLPVWVLALGGVLLLAAGAASARLFARPYRGEIPK